MDGLKQAARMNETEIRWRLLFYKPPPVEDIEWFARLVSTHDPSHAGYFP